MKIAIVGIINHDTITMADGQELQDLGGILYNTAVLANLVDASVLLFPISRIGDDCRPMMEKVLAPYPNVETSGIATSSEGTSRNTIRYDDQMEKIEQLTNHIRPVSFDQIEPFLDCDAVLVNFIIGDDISLADLASIRSQSRALIYLDVHNLCLGIDDQGFRYQRRPDDWEVWMARVDVVQMNEIEAGLLSGRSLENDQDFIDMGKRVLELGPTVFIATRGRSGVVTVFRRDDSIEVIVNPPDPVENIVDTTGCGDAFAAGFLTDYLVTENAETATRLGGWTAGVNCTLAGLSQVDRFRMLREARSQ